ncbi:MAG: hypothetical protein DRP85_06830 [Candidatus Makaraimicrobium thalassicum]|nr:MAG: hypothetical protein DRP85_06830 [Candidatus Omnitrophota bacterium]
MNMIERDPKYYVTGYKGEDPYKAPFYLRALVFDGREGDFNTALVNAFNGFLQKQDRFSKYCLVPDRPAQGKIPAKIVVINASHDDLPTSDETARIFEDLCREKGHAIPAKVVNTREELMKEVSENPGQTLVMSQCVDKNVYNVTLAEELDRRGTVTVPGRITAPGGVFSDKDSTYRLLSDGGRDWGSVARYKKISVEGKNTEDVARGIFTAIDELQRETGQATFFVKPHEGGGGLGGFRVTKTENGYIIPDLSKVTGDVSDIHPTFIDFDVTSEARLRELLWIYRLFASDKHMAANYLRTELPVSVVPDSDDREGMRVLKEYILGSAEKQKRKLFGMVMTGDEARTQLAEAISVFEAKFSRRYIPLVNEHIDFGLWGLRAHYRLSGRGPVLETMYHRVFQLGFTEEGLGYLGSDNISNKQTGDLEILRLGPVNEIMLASIGGETALFETLLEGAEALIALAELVPEQERNRVPLRLQIDLAAVSRRIGEGNADTARGLCLASRWSEFVQNAREWLEDSLAYYAWKKT